MKYDNQSAILVLLFGLSLFLVWLILDMQRDARPYVAVLEQEPNVPPYVAGPNGLVGVQYDQWSDDYYTIQGGLKMKLPI